MFLNMSMTELLSQKEELCDELELYYNEGKLFNTVRHPLVFSVPHNPVMNALLNKQLEVKKQALKQALKEKDYSRYVFLHEKPYRFDAFCKIKDDLSSCEYWDLLGEIWVNSENIWQNKKGWMDLLSVNIPGIYKFMDKDDRKVYNLLPDVVTCYRGYIPGKNMAGLSYTLSIEKAEWFANRYSKKGKVLTIKVPKSKVFAYINSRSEQEIIII